MKNAFFLVLLLAGHAALSQIPKPQKNTYVNDFANVLTAGQIKELNEQIFNIEKNSSVQLAIVLVNEVPAAYEIEDYALLIGRKWHVGTNKNGIVYVAAIDQHHQRLQIATNLNGTFNKEKCSAILSLVTPYFKQQDYIGGLTTLVNQISQTLGADGQNTSAVAAGATTAQGSQAAGTDDNTDFFVGLAFFALIICIIIFAIRRGRRNRMARMYGAMNNNGFNGGPMYNNQYPNQAGPGVGSFVAGAAAGALLGYEAEQLLNQNQNLSNNPGGQNYDNSNNPAGQSTPQDYGNWGGGSTSDNSSSSDDSGFSADFSSDDSGSSSDW